MNEFDDLAAIATRRERAASRRLARAWNLSEADALRRTLEDHAGAGGLPALIGARRAALAAARSAAAARKLERDATRAASAAARSHAPHNPSGWTAWFDGSARPNPGRCTIGALLRGPGGVALDIARPAGHGDSSDAEYRALIAVLDAALAHDAADLVVYGDSRVVIDDVNGPAQAAAPALAAYRSRVVAQLAQLPGTLLRWIPRHRNGAADALSQRGFDAASDEAASSSAEPPIPV